MKTPEAWSENGPFRWRLIGLIWLAWGFLNASRLRLVAGLDWPTALTFGLPDALVWAALTPAVIWLSRRFQIRGQGLLRGLAMHLLAAGGIALFHSAIDTALNTSVFALGRYFGESAGLGPGGVAEVYRATFRHILRYTLHINLLIYFVVTGFAHYEEFSRRLARGQRRTLELEARLTEARLSSLQRQLRPHFLFNTLHTVSALMGTDPELGRRVVRRLGELLRASLRRGDEHLVSLEEELDLVEAYLEVEQARFGDRLNVDLDLAPEALACRVPVLILQPMVENAVHHGISKNPEGGTLRIVARVEGGSLEIEILDDGPGLPEGAQPGIPREEPGAAPGGGIGLENVTARLQALYGGSFRLEVEPTAPRGVRVRLSLPRGPGFEP